MVDLICILQGLIALQVVGFYLFIQFIKQKKHEKFQNFIFKLLCIVVGS